MSWYDWGETLTYDAPVTMVVGARNTGKTFGMREQLLRDFIKRGERFLWVTRYKDGISGIAEGFFSAVLDLTQDPTIAGWRDTNRPTFAYSKMAYRVRYADETGKLGPWQTCGYFANLSVRQASKERTFAGVRRIVMDECIIEPEDRRFRRYLGDEWGNLASVVTSATKGRPEDAPAPRVYLMANAVDLDNPWFAKMGISEIPPSGKSWHRVGDVRVLLDMVPTPSGTPEDVGRAMQGGAAWSNVFETAGDMFVERRPRSANYARGYIYRGQTFGVWEDWARGMCYVTFDFMAGLGRPMYAMTTSDNRVNYIALKPARKALSKDAERYGLGIMRFETSAVRDRFLSMLRDFGIR